MHITSPGKFSSADVGSTDPVFAGLASQLTTQENVLHRLVVDLDERLYFARAAVVLTDHHLLATNAHGQWQRWPLVSTEKGRATLRHFDHAGVGTLELLRADVRLASWRFTLALNVQAMRLVRLFELQMTPVSAAASAPSSGIGLPLCPECDAPLPPDADESEPCASCAHEASARCL